MQRFSTVVSTLVMLGVVRSSIAAVPDSLQQLYETGQYKTLLKEISVELAKAPSKTKPDSIDRYSLLVLKGEALIHLKAGGTAEDAFNAAALVAPDANSIATAKGTAFLVKRSSSNKYQPKTKAADAKSAPAAIDITDTAGRKDAFAALLTDLLEPLAPQMTGLDRTTSLTPIEATARQLGDARNVEIAGTGSDSQTKDMLDKLSKRAGELMTTTLKPMNKQISAIEKSSSRKQNTVDRRVNGNGRTVNTGGTISAGLTMGNVTDLNTMVSQARQIHDAAGQMVLLFGDSADFKTIQTDAEKIIDSANKLLTEFHYPPA